MPPAGPDFRRLHQLHQELKKVQDQLQRGPKQILARQKRVEGFRQELTQKEAELKAGRAEVDRKNLDLKSKEAHLSDLQRKLNTASSNREYEIINGQVDADKAAKAVLEDEVLEYLDRVDVLLQEVEAAKQQIAEAEADARQFATDFESKAGSLQDSVTELQQKIKESEIIVPTEARDQYRRLVSAFGPDGMAEVKDGICSFCYVQLTPQSKVLVNSGRPVFCGSCGRLIYQTDIFLER